MKKSVRMARFIDCYIPINTCNLRCPYCYITQSKRWDAPLPKVTYATETIIHALSQKRLGAVCHFNICGNGETLLCPQLTDIVEGLLREGHFVFIVTNGTVTKVIDKMLHFPHQLRERLGFKFSFHYLQLQERGLVDTFFSNVRKAKEAGCSYMVDITPYDELIPYIDEIKSVCKKNLGAYCHVLVARKNNMRNKGILTGMGKKKYYEIWKTFESDLFEYKFSIFGKKRKEFCYAGDWTFTLNLLSGELAPCYGYPAEQNIYDNTNKPIKFRAVGNHCKEPHCYNGHAFLTLGVIPELAAPNYSCMKNRVTDDGCQWLTPIMKKHLDSKLYQVHKKYSFLKKWYINHVRTDRGI